MGLSKGLPNHSFPNFGEGFDLSFGCFRTIFRKSPKNLQPSFQRSLKGIAKIVGKYEKILSKYKKIPRKYKKILGKYKKIPGNIFFVYPMNMQENQIFS